MLRSPLDVLTRLATREERLVCGIMSGTSVDAVDVALVRIRGGGTGTRIELLQYTEILYPEEIQQRVFANAEVATSNINDICLLHTAIAQIYADAVRQVCNEAGLHVHEVDLIGMHGQTLRHLPEASALGRQSVRSTLQAGSGPTLATLLRVPVVYDFRSADMAAGGQGAPLVPYVDYLLFRSSDEHRLCINIGGIANLTWLPAGCAEEDVLAFDTGPGNMVVDALVRRFHGREFDEDGLIARSGSINPDLLDWLMRNPYFRAAPPKTTGREMFGESYIDSLIQIMRDLNVGSTDDLITTVSECTVRSIAGHVRALVPKDVEARVFISGGGARNRYFIDGLRHALPKAEFSRTEEAGVPADAKEAIAFAVLANEWLQGHPANLPSATGAARRVLLGAFSTGI